MVLGLCCLFGKNKGRNLEIASICQKQIHLGNTGCDTVYLLKINVIASNDSATRLECMSFMTTSSIDGTANTLASALGSTEIWTRIAGFRVLSANRYTMEPWDLLLPYHLNNWGDAINVTLYACGCNAHKSQMLFITISMLASNVPLTGYEWHVTNKIIILWHCVHILLRWCVHP